MKQDCDRIIIAYNTLRDAVLWERECADTVGAWEWLKNFNADHEIMATFQEAGFIVGELLEKNAMTVRTDDDVLILIAAFRYALGRATYITDTVASFILHNWDQLNDNEKKLIVREILDAKDRGEVGQDCDWHSWKRILRRAHSDGPKN